MKLLYGFKDALLGYNVNIIDAECRDILMHIVKSKCQKYGLNADSISEQYLTMPFKYELLLAYTLATLSDDFNNISRHLKLCDMENTFTFFKDELYDIWTQQKNSCVGLYGILKSIFKGRLICVYNQNFIDKCVIETEYIGS